MSRGAKPERRPTEPSRSFLKSDSLLERSTLLWMKPAEGAVMVNFAFSGCQMRRNLEVVAKPAAAAGTRKMCWGEARTWYSGLLCRTILTVPSCMPCSPTSRARVQTQNLKAHLLMSE